MLHKLVKGSGWVPKALLNFQQIVGVEEYFLQYNVPTEEHALTKDLLHYITQSTIIVLFPERENDKIIRG